MSRRALSRTAVTVAMLMTACSGPSSATNAGADALPACTRTGTPFENLLAFTWNDEKHEWGSLQWIDRYHETTSKVIDEYMLFLGFDVTVRDERQDEQEDPREKPPVLRCTEDDYRSTAPAGIFLRELAAQLQPWRGKSPDALSDILSAADAPHVLLEYLRELECSLKEEEMRAEDGVLQNVGQLLKAGTEDRILQNYSQSRLLEETARRKELIQKQLAVLRPSLERTLLLLSGTDRLRPLFADIECIERISLDMRNVVSLLPEAASCAVRATDAVNPLRFR